MKKKINPINIFIIISAISVIISFFTFVFGNDTFSAVNATGGFHKLFNDFIFHLYLSDDLNTVYTKSIHICFPPLIYLFYHALNLMMPPHAKTDINYNAMYNLCVIYLIIGFLIFAFIIKRFLKKQNDKKVLLTVILLTLSSCFTFGIIQCANIAFLVVMLLLLAVDLRESDSKFKQELAMILIAIAAAIKIYPAVFGLLYLAERKYKEAGRLIIYGILFFAVPFAFTGGIEGFNLFLSNQLEVQTTWGELSPNGIYTNLVSLGFSEILSKAIIVVFGTAAIIFVFICKDNWKKLFMLNFIMVMCPMWSGAYTPAFFVIPFLYLVSEKEYIKSKVDLIYILLFSLLFTSSCFTFEFSSQKIFVIAMLIFAIVIVDEVFSLKNNKAKKVIDNQ